MATRRRNTIQKKLDDDRNNEDSSPLESEQLLDHDVEGNGSGNATSSTSTTDPVKASSAPNSNNSAAVQPGIEDEKKKKKEGTPCRQRVSMILLYILVFVLNLVCLWYITTKRGNRNSSSSATRAPSQLEATKQSFSATNTNKSTTKTTSSKPFANATSETNIVGTKLDMAHQHDQHDTTSHSIAGLSCEKYGGPSSPTAINDVIYWQDIASDANYKSHFMHKHKIGEKFITFEPDIGGWNNIRMAMETILAIAHATGRTIVIPPEKKMYRLTSGVGQQKTDFTFHDFFHLQSLHTEHDGITIISMEEFLTQQGMKNKLLDKTVKLPVKPPGGRVKWDGMDLRELWMYLRMVGHDPEWDPNVCIAAFPDTTDRADTIVLQKMMDAIVSEKTGPMPNPKEYRGKPIPVDANAMERLKEMLAGRKKMCVYDKDLQETRHIHFMVDPKNQKGRILTHFYAFMFFEDWRQALWTKRFVRDHMRYVDEIMCAAGRIVEAVKERARKRQPKTNAEGEYDAFHIRRGDFQYKHTRIDAGVIYENTLDFMTANATVYVATDERNRVFFQPLEERYDLVYLSDFQHLFEGINTNYYGMLDQVVAANSRIFCGTYLSTFTGYINRLRGYYSVKKKLNGYKYGAIQSYYYVPKERKNVMREYYALERPFFAREYPTAWYDIDHDVDTELSTDGTEA